MELKSSIKLFLISNIKKSSIPITVNKFYLKRLYSDIKNQSFKRTSNLKVAFFGTDLFSIKILNGLHKLLDEKKIKEINVITSASPRENYNREKSDIGSSSIEYKGILDFCRQNNIKHHIWSEIKINKNYEQVLKGFDIGLVASFGHLLPASLIEVFPWGVLNVHPSLLPRWRGASPLVFQILFNDKIVGTSLMKILPKHFDIGPILAKKSVEITPRNFTTYKLLDYLSNIGNEMIVELFEDFSTNINKTVQQSNESVCYAHKISNEMFFIDWENQNMSEIDCQYRGLHEIKHLKTKFNDQVIKLVEMVPFDLINSEYAFKFENLKGNCKNLLPGTVRFSKKDKLIAIKCQDGFVGFRHLIIKKKISYQDFNNGYLKKSSDDIVFQSTRNTIKDFIYKPKIKTV